MPDINAVGIISKPGIPHASTILPELVAWLDSRGIASRFDKESAFYLSRSDGLPRPDVPEGTQLVIVLGGDGTLLSAARAIGGREIPLFAVNLGGLGFLTAITVDEIYPQLERVLLGDFHIGRRRMLHCEWWRDEHLLAAHEALNDM